MKIFLGRLLPLLFLLFVAGNASAGLIRYDVSYLEDTGGPASSGDVPSFEGYMIFSDTAPKTGNIWSYIVDWAFTLDGFVIDSSNTEASVGGYLAVGGLGNIVSDWMLLPTLSLAAPGFTSPGPPTVDSISLGFTSFAGGLAFADYPGSSVRTGLDSSGSVSYSGPRIVPSLVPTPATLSLAIIALSGLLRSRR